MEDQRLVHPVQELRPEVAAQLLEKPVLEFVGVALVFEDHRTADVAGHDDDRILETDRAPLRIGHDAVLQHLQQDVEHIRVRFFDLIEQHHRVRTAPHRFGQLSALLVADVSRRSADQTRYAEFLHVFRHVDPHHRALVVEKILRQRAGQFGLAHPGRAEENEARDRTVRVLQPGAGAKHRVGDRRDRLVLADHPFVEPGAEFQEFFLFTLHQLRDRNVGPAADDRGDILFVHLLFQQAAAGIGLDRRFGFGDLVFDLRDRAVLELGGLLVVVFAGRLVQLRLGEIEGFAVVPQVGDRLFLILILRAQHLAGLLEFGDFGFEALAALDRSGVLFVAQAGDFDFELHHPALVFVEFGRGAVDFGAQRGGGFVDEVDRLVRQEPVGDVLVRKHRGGDQRAVPQLHAVVDFIAFLQAAQDRNGVLDARRIDQHRLEPAFQRGVLLDILAVFVEGGRADAVQFATRQHGFEQIARVHRTLGGARADHGVQFVDEEDHLALGGGDLLEHGFQAFFKFAAVLGSGDQRAHVEGDDLTVFQVFGNVAAHDAAGESFDDGGFADAGFADQDRVVLGAARQDLDHAADLVVTADHRVEFVLHRHQSEVAGILLQRLKGVFRIGGGDPLVAADALQGLQYLVGGEPGLGQQLIRGAAGRLEHRQQQVFDADVFILHGFGLLGGIDQQCAEFARLVDLLLAADARQGAERLVDLFVEKLAVYAEFFEDGGDESVVLPRQRGEHVQIAQFAVGVLHRDVLRRQQRFTGFVGKFFEVHTTVLLFFIKCHALSSRRRAKRKRRPLNSGSGGVF